MKQHLEVQPMVKKTVSIEEWWNHVTKDWTEEQKAEGFKGGLEGAAEAEAFSLGWKLRALRQEAGLTQMQLAEKVGLQQREITRIENGNGNPTLRTITRLLLAFGKTLDVVDDKPLS